MQARRRQAIALKLRRYARRARSREQLLARQLEQLDRVVVRVDEDVPVDVEHDDGFGRVLDERAITRFAFAQRLLVLQPLGDVAHAKHEALLGAVTRAADGHLDGERLAAAALRLDQLRRRVDERVADAIGKRVESRAGRHELRDEARDVAVRRGPRPARRETRAAAALASEHDGRRGRR